MMGETDPAAAIKVLDSLSSADEGADEGAVMRRELLRLRLQGRGVCVQTSDVEARRVYDYFKEHGNRSERLEASFCLAGVYRDIHDSPQAIRYYNETLERASASSRADSLIMADAYQALSALYGLQYNHKLAMEMAEKGLEMARHLGIVTPKRLMSVAAAARGMNDAYTVLLYEREALSMIEREGSLGDNANVVCGILTDASEYRFAEEARKCKALLDTVRENRRPRGFALSMATYHKNLAHVDSAIFYFRSLFETSISVGGKCEASRDLALLYERKGDVRQSQRYALAFMHAERDYRNALQHEQAVSAHNEFVYNRNAAREMEMQKEAEEAKVRNTYWLLAFLLLLALSSVFILMQRNRNLKRRNRALGMMKEMEDEIQRGRDFVAGKEARIRELQDQIEEADSKLSSKDCELRARRTDLLRKEEELQEVESKLREKELQLAEKLEQNKRLLRFAFSENLQQSADDVLERFRKAAGGRYHLSEAEWKQLFAAIDALYPAFREAVIRNIPKPTEDKLRIAYLLKAGMNKPQITNLTGYPTTTVWRKSKQITETLGEELWGLNEK